MPWEIKEKEIWQRLKDPGDFKPQSFRSKDIGNGIRLILGRLKGETTMTAQAIRFDKSKWDLEKAKAWLKEHPSLKTKAERYRGKDKGKCPAYEMIHDIIDPHVRWKKRPSGDFDEQTISVYDIDLEAGIKAKLGQLKGETQFAVKEYIFPPDWQESDIKKWLLVNEQKIRITIEKLGE